MVDKRNNNSEEKLKIHGQKVSKKVNSKDILSDSKITTI
jgi:hypothetical protein